MSPAAILMPTAAAAIRRRPSQSDTWPAISRPIIQVFATLLRPAQKRFIVFCGGFCNDCGGFQLQ
jgi:hypothetical protein